MFFFNSLYTGYMTFKVQEILRDKMRWDVTKFDENFSAVLGSLSLRPLRFEEIKLYN